MLRHYLRALGRTPRLTLSAALATAVTFALVAMGSGPAAAQRGGPTPTPAPAPASAQSVTTFQLFPNTPFLNCLATPGTTPSVSVTVQRGDLNDQMTLTLTGFKPGLQFDLFTVQHSSQLADGSRDPAFTGSFGMAWYQSDIEVDGRGGSATVTINTILLNQIFGFDADTGLAPTNTFHVGFWFNNPDDAAPCGFTGFTPFNGEHHAGPLAFISRPNPATGLGPLCTNPNGSGGCNP